MLVKGTNKTQVRIVENVCLSKHEFAILLYQSFYFVRTIKKFK